MARSQGQLASEAQGTATYNYTYDTAGNILSVKNGTSAYKTYTYGNANWKDLLTNFKIGSLSGSITYDAIGNPTSYFNGSRYAMTWAQGRRLASATKNGTTSSYNYDKTGIRTTKTVGTTTYNYITQNGQVVRQTWSGRTLDIIYDNNNAPYACVYTAPGASPVTYYYLTNQQGDVERLVTAAGTSVAEYTYDAWGAPLTATGAMATINPIRYRGYYYDTESGFYYLQSRYYDPAIGRFINADAAELSEINKATNLFAYCGNNPVMMKDVDGEIGALATAIVCGAISGVVSAVTTAVCGGSTAEIIGSLVGGFASGALGTVSTVSKLAIGIVSGVCSAIADGYTQYKETGSIDLLTTLGNGAITGASSIIGVKIGKNEVAANAMKIASTAVIGTIATGVSGFVTSTISSFRSVKKRTSSANRIKTRNKYGSIGFYNISMLKNPKYRYSYRTYCKYRSYFSRRTVRR